MAGYRPEFEAALRLFARVSEAMKARVDAARILVGGAAVEIYTNSAITTGDFDIVTARQKEFEVELLRHGFSTPEGLGHTPLGWVHAELRLGFEVVSSTLLGGMADRDRVLLLDLGADGEAAIVSIEDMIADRMGQFASVATRGGRRLVIAHAPSCGGGTDRGQTKGAPLAAPAPTRRPPRHAALAPLRRCAHNRPKAGSASGPLPPASSPGAAPFVKEPADG